MVQVLVKQIMDQTRGCETDQGIVMNGTYDVIRDKTNNTSQNQLRSGNSLDCSHDCQPCLLRGQLVHNRNMKFGLKNGCGKTGSHHVLLPSKSLHCSEPARVTSPQAIASVTQAREAADGHTQVDMLNNQEGNCDSNELVMDGASLEGVNIDATESFDHLALNESSNLQKDIAVKVLSADFTKKDKNSVSHAKGDCIQSDLVSNMDTSSFCNQIGSEMLNETSKLCGSVAMVAGHGPGCLECSVIQTDASHNSGLFNREHNEYGSRRKVLYENDIYINHNVSVNVRPMQESTHYRCANDISVDISHINIHRLHGQDNVKRDTQDNYFVSQSVATNDAPSDVLNEANLLGDKVDVSDQASPKTSSEKLLVKSEPQGRTYSLTRNLKAPSSAESGCGALKSSIGTADNESLRNFPRENSGQAGNSLPPQSACKVVTKYVFINKPSLHLPSKKGFGVLYKHAFRHYHESKQKKKKQLVVREKETKKESTNKQDLEKKKILVDFALKEHFLQQQNRETRNKCREERRLSRELKKNAFKDANDKVSEKKKERKLQSKRIKKKEKGKEMRKGKKVKTKSSHKDKQTILKLHCNIEKVVTKNGSDEDNSSKSGKRGCGISRTQVWRILKRKHKVHTENVDRVLPEVKRSKKHTKNIEKEDLEIKQEVTDGEKEDSIHNMEDIVDEDVPFQQMRAKMRNRKDLTLQEKVQAIGALEMPGSKLVAVAKRFGVSVSAISRINKNREYILLQSVSGDLNSTQRRSRECKDPELDKVLLRWFRTIENLRSPDTPINISNVLLKEKAHELAITMGKNYFPSDNWIIRWKNRHNIGLKSSVTIMVQDRDELKQFDCKVNISEVLEEMGKQEFKIDQVKRESLMRRSGKPEELFICEHCGVLTSSKKKKVNNHLVGCPASSVRKDLTLEEKVQVVRALEQPGVKMVTLAKKYGVSASAISRIQKNRVNILARRASGLANSARRRDRGSKEPEVERVLCEWFKVQHELGIHISGSMIREKARDIARVMGKDFWPSESWVFRWRHRNNVTDINTFLYGDSDEEELGCLQRNNDTVEAFSNSGEDGPDDKYIEGDEGTVAENSERNKARKGKTVPDELLASKQFRLPRSVMCEKCGFVSNRVKNNRIKSLRHAKGCPDLKPRNELTYENRARMLKALELPGATLSSVARQFGVSVSSMSRMNQKKDQILSHSEDHADQKRIRDCKEPEVANHLYQWYMQKKAEGVHITGPKLKEKATKFAAEMGREFTASSGWLGRWRHRYNIISSVKTVDRMDPAKRRKCRKGRDNNLRNSEQAQLHALSCEPHQDSLGSAASVIVESLDPVQAQQQSHAAPVFIHQRFQNPWEMSQQQDESCVWTKEFLTPAGPSILDDSAVSVAYTYGDAVSKPIFQNVFDSFSAVGYQVAMPLDPGMIVGRDYLKPDIGEDKYGSSTVHISHSSHGQHSHHLSANLSTQNLHHQVALAHPHSLSHPQQPQTQPQSQVALTMPPPSPAALEDDPEQQRQVMEAFKIMSSFAQKKSLGDQVQAALRTIEMSMKSSARKTSSSTLSRNSYTSI